MKLAEALQERADLNRRIQQLQQRLGNNAIVQENEKPIEDPKALLEELDRCIASLEDIITRINLTNCRTQVDGESLTALLARRASGPAAGRSSCSARSVCPRYRKRLTPSPGSCACWTIPSRRPTGPPS